MNAAPLSTEKLEAFLNRAIQDLASSSGGVLVSLGARLGLYKAMAGAGPMTATELAARSQCAARYVQEWLNGQVAGGYVAYHPISQTYELTAEQALVLADEDSPWFIPHAWNVQASMWHDEEKAIEAFRTGRGVAWGEHHDRLFCGVAAFYRNAYRASLVSQWLPALEGVQAHLEAGIQVADVGCGHGHSTALMAGAFPRSQFHGFDPHGPSINTATELAEKNGVHGNTRFSTARATDYPKPEGGYGLICFFDCLHDLGDPVAAARHAAASLAPGGTVMLVEPFAHDDVQDNVSPVARLYYAGSTVLCCAHAISEGGHLVLGAQAGEARLAGVFRKAGFTHFRRAVATPFNLVLEARL